MNMKTENIKMPLLITSQSSQKNRNPNFFCILMKKFVRNWKIGCENIKA